ncbi:MAG: hypothetical protein HND42_07595 [Armatimonadetes bacterium]|nr:hypothetical protein [Armatimonadota bacterium]NOG93087.1 hypothetical protein [Armatimonadota bacterium]
MAMKVVYTVFDGEIVGENRNGSLTDYVPDPLGSTVALLDTSQTQTDTFNYWPYGEVQSRTGSTATPFQFVGTIGYHTDTATRTYVRARVLANNLATWQTADPAFVWLNPYRYSLNSPVSRRDPTGLIAEAGVLPLPEEVKGYGEGMDCIQVDYIRYGSSAARCWRCDNFSRIDLWDCLFPQVRFLRSRCWLVCRYYIDPVLLPVLVAACAGGVSACLALKHPLFIGLCIAAVLAGCSVLLNCEKTRERVKGKAESYGSCFFLFTNCAPKLPPWDAAAFPRCCEGYSRL